MWLHVFAAEVASYMGFDRAVARCIECVVLCLPIPIVDVVLAAAFVVAVC